MLRQSQCRVRDQRHCTSGVWRPQSLQFLPVAFWLKFLRGPACAFLNAWWALVLCTRGYRYCLLLRWPPLQSGIGPGTDSRGPLLLFRDSRGLFAVHARAGRASRLVVRGSRESPLRARRIALMRTRSWSNQCGLVAAIHDQIRADLRARGDSIASERNASRS